MSIRSTFQETSPGRGTEKEGKRTKRTWEWWEIYFCLYVRILFLTDFVAYSKISELFCNKPVHSFICCGKYSSLE